VGISGGELPRALDGADIASGGGTIPTGYLPDTGNGNDSNTGPEVYTNTGTSGNTGVEYIPDTGGGDVVEGKIGKNPHRSFESGVSISDSATGGGYLPNIGAKRDNSSTDPNCTTTAP
jgi:hypothetical protein